MSKILPQGTTISTVCNDVITKTLESIRIGQQAGPALNDLYNIIIGVNAGYSVNYVNNCIFFGYNSGKGIKTGSFNIIFGNNYNNSNYVNFITTIGYDNYNYDKSSVIGTSNVVYGTSNYTIGYNNKIIGENNYLIGNDLYISSNNNILYGNNYNIKGVNNICLGYGVNILNDDSVLLGLNSNIYGDKNIVIGNYNTNYSNVILIGNKNKGTYLENSIIIGNNIDDYRFSLNIDNTICKYTQNNNSTIFLGIGYNSSNSTPVLIGFNDINIITSNKNALYIKGGLAADELRVTNSSNYYISLKNNEDIKQNITYTLPPVPKNTDNILLSSDSNGILNWLNVTNFQIIHLIVKGTITTTILNAGKISGDGSSLFNINLNKNTTDNIKEGNYTKFYNDYRITNQFDNYVNLHSTNILDQGIANFYFDYEKDYKNFLLNVEYTTTDIINEGVSNIYYSSKLYNKYDDINYSNITTDILQEGTSNFYFTKTTDYLYFNKILASNTNTDYLPEGKSNIYFTQKRFDLNFYSNLGKITTNNLKQGTSNLYYNSNLIANVIYTTDNIKEGKNNYFLNIQRVKNIINSIIITTDNLKQGNSNLYYHSNINFSIISDNLRQGLSNLYYTSNLYDKITTDNINVGSSNLYFNSNIYINNFYSNIITLDYLKKGNKNSFIQNNTYNDNLNILGTLYCCNINNIFSNISSSDNVIIGSNTIINNIYETNNIDIINDINCDINFTYNYYDDFGSNIDVYTPLIVTETNVGINNINPIHSLDVVGKIRADEYIGAGSNIYDINWDNIVNIPKIRSEYDYYRGNFEINNLIVSLKNIYSTDNEYPIIIQNNFYDNNFNNINNTNEYYYVFTSTNSNSIIFNDDCLCKVFMIGGGGGGGDYFGGGGGAGSYYYNNFTFYKNIEYKINIGEGGLGGIYNNRISKNGGDTYILSSNSLLLVNGGGSGGGFLNTIGGNGGNGGGGTGYNLNNIINNGGISLSSNFYNGTYGISDFDNYINIGGGGGGNSSYGNDGNGGGGILINIKNFFESYGGGGGGGYQNALGNNPGYGGLCYYNGLTYKNGGDGGNNDNTNGYDAITFGSGGGGGGYQGNGGNGANGCLIIKFSHSNITKFLGNLDNPLNPSYTWNDTTTTGIYHSCNLIGFSINGIEKIKITDTGVIGDGSGLSNISINWSNINFNETSNMSFNNIGSYNWYNNSSLIMQLSNDGNLSLKGSTTIYNLSDKNLKYDIKDLENSLEIINKIKPISFKWKNNNIIPENFYDKEDIGFIAQELINIIPSTETNYFNYKAIRYEKIIPYLVKSIQILEKRIIELEKINIL
jgi:hypothetical protein